MQAIVTDYFAKENKTKSGVKRIYLVRRLMQVDLVPFNAGSA